MREGPALEWAPAAQGGAGDMAAGSAGSRHGAGMRGLPTYLVPLARECRRNQFYCDRPRRASWLVSRSPVYAMETGPLEPG